MKCTYEPYSNVSFATNLRKKDDVLKWDTGKGGATLVFQGSFGADILPDIEKICEKLSRMDSAMCEEFASMSPEFPYLSVRLMDAQQKAKEGGCAVKGEVSRYTILACRITGDECHIYEPKKRQSVDVPAEVTITCAKVYDTFQEGFFRKRERQEFAGFYEVRIENKSLSAYRDGDIFYAVNDINIPITALTVKEGVFYIKTQQMPQLKSNSEGYSLHISEID